MTELRVVEIREIGRGITLGKCAKCGVDVKRGKFDSDFVHTFVEVITRHANGQPCHSRHTHTPICE